MLIYEFIHHPNVIGRVNKYKIGWYKHKKGLYFDDNYQIRNGELKLPTQRYQIVEEYTLSDSCWVHSFDSKLENLLLYTNGGSYGSYASKLYNFNIKQKQITQSIIVKTRKINNGNIEPYLNSSFYRLDDNKVIYRTTINGDAENSLFVIGIFSISQNDVILENQQYGDNIVGNCCYGNRLVATNLDKNNKTIYFIGNANYNGDYRIEKLHYETGQIEKIYDIPNSGQNDGSLFIKIKDNLYYNDSYNTQTIYKYPNTNIFKYFNSASIICGSSTEDYYVYNQWGWGNYGDYVNIFNWNTYQNKQYILTDKNGNRITQFGFLNNNNGNALDSESCLWTILNLNGTYQTKLVRICPI